jgi:hypothetical protein
MKTLKPIKVNPRDIKGRDVYSLMLIAGATKAAVHVDRRKAASRKACRGESKEAW